MNSNTIFGNNVCHRVHCKLFAYRNVVSNVSYCCSSAVY